MAPETWNMIMARLSPQLLSSPLSTPLLPALYKEVHTAYEDTIRNTTIKMTLVKPTGAGGAADTPLYSEPV